MKNEFLERLQNYLLETYKTSILENFLGLEINEIEQGKEEEKENVKTE